MTIDDTRRPFEPSGDVVNGVASTNMLALSIVTFASVVCVVRLFMANKSRFVGMHEHIQSKRLLASFIRTLGAVLWPLVLLCVVKREDRTNSALILPIVWNVLVWLVDMHFVHHAAETSGSKPASIRIDPMLLGGLAFGICNLIGNRPDSKHAYLFMYAVVTCFLFVMPSHTLQSGCIEEQVVENVQKVVLYYCIGFLFTGVLLTRSFIESNVS
jgi:hypothetical protein